MVCDAISCIIMPSHSIPYGMKSHPSTTIIFLARRVGSGLALHGPSLDLSGARGLPGSLGSLREDAATPCLGTPFVIWT